MGFEPRATEIDGGDTPNAMWQDALDQSKKQTAAWPFDWVQGVDYPHKDQRANVTGQLVVNDPMSPTPWTKFSSLTVGLAYPDSVAGIETGGSGGRNFRGVSWVNDAKHYEFWVRGSDDGHFTIPNVRPGTYTLHAIATGNLLPAGTYTITTTAATLSGSGLTTSPNFSGTDVIKVVAGLAPVRHTWPYGTSSPMIFRPRICGVL